MKLLIIFLSKCIHQYAWQQKDQFIQIEVILDLVNQDEQNFRISVI